MNIPALNSLIAEFDLQTGFQFDRETDPHQIMLIASMWPNCRRTLGEDLAKAFREQPKTKMERINEN